MKYSQEERDARIMYRQGYILAVILVVILIFVLATNLTIFEDGSWAVGSYPYPIHGCLPWDLCAK